MPNNFQVTQGSGTTIAAEQGVGLELYQKIKLIDPTPGATGGIGITGTPLKIDGSAVTQPVSIASMPSTPVTGTFFQATQPVSASALPLPTGASTSAKQPALGTAGTPSADVLSVQGTASMTALKVDGSAVTQPVSGTITANAGSGSFTVAQATAANLNVTASQGGTWTVQPGNTANTTAWKVDGSAVTQPVNITNPVLVTAAVLAVTATAATGVAVTATLPAVAAQFHYITLIEIVKYFTVANAASATPLVVTTTNLPGSLAYTFGQPLGTVGTTDRIVYASNSPLHSSVVNTATTIVCPATTGIIWRVNVYYFTAA